MNLKNIQRGAFAGFAGGIVFGIMMGMMGMLTLIGQMVGLPNALAGFVIHLMISAFIGATFAILFDASLTGRGASLAYGTAYGAFWWLLGPLTLMPLMMGMGLSSNWTAGAAAQMLPSLVGHIVYGLILGGTYQWLARGVHAAAPRSATSVPNH